MTRPSYDIGMIGHFAVDRLTIGGESVTASGGAVYYGAMALVRLGYRVAVITRMHRDDFPRLDELRNAGIGVYVQEADETAGMENIYHTKDRDKRTCKSLGFAGPFTVEELPDVDASLRLVIPILAGEVDMTILRAIAKRGPVGLDVQGFVRFAEGSEVVFRDWPEKAEGLQYVRWLKVDDTEAEVLTGETDLRAAARALASLGPDEVLITHKNGVLVYAKGAFYTGSFAPKQVLGRTGRGDTCFTAYCAKRLSVEPGEACRYAAAVTSLKMEAPGPFTGTTEDVEAFLRSS